MRPALSDRYRCARATIAFPAVWRNGARGESLLPLPSRGREPTMEAPALLESRGASEEIHAGNRRLHEVVVVHASMDRDESSRSTVRYGAGTVGTMRHARQYSDVLTVGQGPRIDLEGRHDKRQLCDGRHERRGAPSIRTMA